MKKLLIVDDDCEILKKYSSYAEELGLEVLIADCPSQAYTLASMHKPEYATVDHDIMSPGEETTGNQVGTALKRLSPEIKMAGITGGNPGNFKEELFMIRESKGNVGKSEYCQIIRALQGIEPVKDREREAIEIERVACVSIILQGYYAGKSILEGKQPYDTPLPIPNDLDKYTIQIRELLDFSKIGIDIDELYTQLDAAGLLEGVAIREFMTRVKNGDRDLDKDLAYKANEDIKKYFDRIGGGQ